jgi:hypothetical protein
MKTRKLSQKQTRLLTIDGSFLIIEGRNELSQKHFDMLKKSWE